MTKFLDEGKITISKIPKYHDFEQQFVEPVDFLLCKVIITDKLLTPQMIQAFKNSVMANIQTNGNLFVIHKQNHKIGRYFATEGKSIIPNARLIKHTLMFYGKWRDLDMVKGHPSIACEVFKGIILQLQHRNY